MNPNIRPSERVALLDTIEPVSQAAGTVTTGWIAAADFENFLAKLAVGALGTSATVDAKLQQASDSSGTGAKDITGKAITQLTKAGTDDNKQVLINLRADELDRANAFTHFRLSVTVATAACLIYGEVLGFDAHYGPASGFNQAAVDETIA